MKKTITLLKAMPEVEAEAFARWFFEDFAPRELADLPEAERCVVYVPTGTRPKPGMDTPKEPPYEIIIEIWSDSDAAAIALPSRLTTVLVGFVQELHSYGVEERVMKDTLDPVRGGRGGISPGVSLWTMLRRVHGIDIAEFRRHWSEHAPLAIRVHVGATAYRQNRVNTIFTPGAPEFDGFATLSFDSEEDLRDRLFAKPDDVQDILKDSAEFVGFSLSMTCTEHVIKNVRNNIRG